MANEIIKLYAVVRFYPKDSEKVPEVIKSNLSLEEAHKVANEEVENDREGERTWITTHENIVNMDKVEAGLVAKRTSRGFGKKVYLLGIGEDGTYYWLEEAKWDCGWYWGFGYIEAYTNNKNPQSSRDIQSHQHWESSIVGEGKENKSGYMGSYCHNPYNSNFFNATTFNESEGWELAELFQQYYTLKETAEYFTRGKANVTDSIKIDRFKKPELVEEINKVILPKIFARIYQILTPEAEQEASQ